MASLIHRPQDPKTASRRRATIDRVLDTEMFKVMGEPTRARLLSCLLKCGRPCSVTEIAACCSIDFSMVARHLSTMARAGVLESEKRGRTVWYSAPADALAGRFRSIADAIGELRQSSGCCESDCCDAESDGG